MFKDDSESGLRIYLRQIGQIPLLTREDEVRLAARIKKGDQAARQQMIQANLRLVVKIAHDYSNYGLPLLDLISEGNIGLMKAVDRFDPAKGGKLSTYAAWWIKQSIKRALANQSKTIRLPVHLVDKIARLRRIAMRLAEDFGRDPTDEELAEEMELPVAKISQLRTASIRPASLDAAVSQDEDSATLGDLVRDEGAQSPYDLLQEENLREVVREQLPLLDEREQKILSLRFGLDGKKELTLEEIGKKFKVTRERIRQLQNAGLRKILKAIENKDRGRKIE